MKSSRTPNESALSDEKDQFFVQRLVLTGVHGPWTAQRHFDLKVNIIGIQKHFCPYPIKSLSEMIH